MDVACVAGGFVHVVLKVLVAERGGEAMRGMRRLVEVALSPKILTQ